MVYDHHMERNISKQLKAWKDKTIRHPLIIMGARQIGKTYSLKAFGEESFSRMHYVNFEEDGQVHKLFEKDLNPKRLLEELSFFLDASIDIDNDLLVFDEIQSCPKALTSLKYFSETVPRLAICCAGSLLGLYFGSSSFPVGKVEFLNMYPMSFPEFLLGIEEKRAYDYLMNCSWEQPLPEIVHQRLWECLKKYFVTGGLPEVVDIYRRGKDNPFEAFQQVREKQADLILAYEADMAKHSGKKNSMHISRLWRNIPAQLAREQDGSAPKFKFKDVIPGVKGFSRLAGIIDWLETAGLVIKVPIVNSGALPFSAYGRDNTFKLYIFDTGILGALSQLLPKSILDYDYGSYKGYFAENFTAQEFLCSSRPGTLFSWREVTAEIEFLRNIEGNVIPIEIKSGWVTRAKSLGVFSRKYNPPYRVVMSARHMERSEDKTHLRYPLYLAGRLPLEP